MKHSFLGAACVSLLLVASGGTRAALIDRGGGLIYDTDLNITWLSDANFGRGSSYDLADGNGDGGMTWQNAMNWAANLTYYDSVRDVTYNDWRLPSTLQPDPSCSSQIDGYGAGYNCTGGEMGHLFYTELGGVAHTSITTTHNSNYLLFTNVRTGYWSGTAYPTSINDAWTFTFAGSAGGQQGATVVRQFAWAVRDGDVNFSSTVPIPTAAWLFGCGLLGLVGVAKRKRMD